ncbi:hypothetical protein D9M72_241470 [compost metagenome]
MRQRGGQPVGIAGFAGQVGRGRQPGVRGQHRIADLERVVPRQACDVAAERLVLRTVEPCSGLPLRPRPVHVRQVAVMEQVEKVRQGAVVVVFRAVPHQFGVVQRQRAVRAQKPEAVQAHDRQRRVVAGPRRRRPRKPALRLAGQHHAGDFARREGQGRRLPQPERLLLRAPGQADGGMLHMEGAEAPQQGQEAKPPRRTAQPSHHVLERPARGDLTGLRHGFPSPSSLSTRCGVVDPR